MITALPYKMQAPVALSPPNLQHNSRNNRDEKKRLSEYEFPSPAAKADSLHQSYLNHPFTQLRQQRLEEYRIQQEQQQQRQKISYANKYASYTNSSHPLARSYSNNNNNKPSTTTALSMIEKEKSAYNNSSNRNSIVSPPPPPYLYSDRGVAPLENQHRYQYQYPSPSSPSSYGHTTITPASLAWNKRKSLPVPVLTPSRPATPSFLSSSNPLMAKTTRELKRHSLPVTPSAGAPQWPSAMTMTVAAVTRPKLAKTMPPQSAPIPLGASTPTAVFTPRTSRLLLDRGETDSLYSYKFSSDDGQSTPRSAGSPRITPAGADVRGSHSHFLDMHHRVGTASCATNGSTRSHAQQFPGYWKDAKEHRMHWVFLSLGLMAAGSALWIYLMVPALLIWATALPTVLAVVVGAQYAGYRWRRYQHNKAQLNSHKPSATALSSMRAASAAFTSASASAATTAVSGIATTAASGTAATTTSAATATLGVVAGTAVNHAHRPSHSSMHTSVGSICGDSFLEPHQPSPPNILKSQFQHQYLRSNSSSSTSSSGPPTQFADGYTFHSQQQQQSGYGGNGGQGALPEYRQSWSNQRSLGNEKGQEKDNDNGRSRTIRRQVSSSSIASSETVSSTSTASELEYAGSPSSPTKAINSPDDRLGLRLGAGLGLGSPASSPMQMESAEATKGGMDALVPSPAALKSSDSLCSLDSTNMMVPPPAYVSKKCGEVIISEKGETLSEKARFLLEGGGGLPEIAPVGDLVSEFDFDFGTIQY
ncbi:hypothetical protein BGX20_010424 [Mortierella sp. AD010]|nr:hypothetical protein BGX20_010424 [Mortierella sp. AD010]